MNSAKATLLLSIVLVFGLLSGCDIWGGPEVDENVRAFVQSENLPKAQTPEISVDDPDSDVKVFSVEFGPGCDCPSGCFYSTGYGLEFRDRIGWMDVSQAFCLEDSVRSEVTFFDVRTGDSTLFDQAFRDRFREATEDRDPDGYAPIYEVFLQMLGGDEDTPTGTLNSLIDVLFEGYFPDVARALIDNPVVRSNETLLERLTELPDERYQPIREEAEELLDRDV